MSWNYRIISDKDRSVTIHKVTYNESGQISIHPYKAGLEAETPEDLRAQYEAIGKAFEKPVIDGSSIAGYDYKQVPPFPSSLRWVDYKAAVIEPSAGVPHAPNG